MVHQVYVPKRHPTWSIKEARNALERMVGVMDDWGTFDIWLAQYLTEPGMRRSVTRVEFHRKPGTGARRPAGTEAGGAVPPHLPQAAGACGLSRKRSSDGVRKMTMQTQAAAAEAAAGRGRGDRA